MANREYRDEQRYAHAGERGRESRYRGEESDWDDERGSHGRDDDQWRAREGRYGAREGDDVGGGRFGAEGRYDEGRRSTGERGRRAWAGGRGPSRPQHEGYGERGFGGAYGSGGAAYGPRGEWPSGQGGQYGYGGRTTGRHGRGPGGERGGRFEEGYGELDYGDEGAGSASGRAYGSYDESGEYGSRSRDWERERGVDGEREWEGRRGWEGRRERPGLTERAGRMLGPFTGRGPKGYQRSDERIREDVCDRLMDEGEIDASNLTVEVHGGEVVLEGSVDSKHAKRSAEDIAEEVSGVREVQNRLRVERGSPAARPPSEATTAGAADRASATGTQQAESGQGVSGLMSGSADKGAAAFGDRGKTGR